MSEKLIGRTFVRDGRRFRVRRSYDRFWLEGDARPYYTWRIERYGRLNWQLVRPSNCPAEWSKKTLAEVLNIPEWSIP